MFSSLRSRLLAALTGAIFLAVVTTTAVIAVMAGSSLALPRLTQVAGVIVSMLALLWLVGIVMAYVLTRPLDAMARASRELAEGRHPEEALEAVPELDEMAEITGSFRDMAMRLREVDSSDRRFLMSVSHELRTPLTAITGHAQALEDGLADDVEVRNRSLAVIRSEAGRLERLIEDIIDLAKLRTSRFNTANESVYLDELGEHLMAIFQDRSAHPHIVVRGEFEEIMFHSDGHRILQVLRNLVNNALRYARSEVVVTGERVRGHVRLTVLNDGDPIPADLHEKIFEPFVGTKREGGMGLGLAIGRELAWALGGNLRSLEVAEGALFELTLPLEPPGFGR